MRHWFLPAVLSDELSAMAYLPARLSLSQKFVQYLYPAFSSAAVYLWHGAALYLSQHLGVAGFYVGYCLSGDVNRAGGGAVY